MFATEAEERRWREACARAEHVRALSERRPTSLADVDAVATACGVSRSTIFRWLRRYREGAGLTSDLAPRPPGLRAGASLMPVEVEQVMGETIGRALRKRERLRPSKIVEEVADACRRAGLSAPGDNTIRRRIRAFRDPLRQEASGRRLADPRTATPGSFPETTEPLSVVQIDHTLVDAVVVDPEHRQPVGRPWLTLAVDVATRVVVGFHLTMMSPSVTSVAACLAFAMTPKTRWLALRGLDLDYPVHGRPARIHVDNGPEFHAGALAFGCAEYGIDLQYRPPGAPRFGGHVERLIGTTMGDVHLLPGTTQSNPRERGRYASEAQAALTLEEMERWLALGVDVYHNRRHAGLGVPPLHRWRALRSGVQEDVRAPEDPEDVLVAFLPMTRRRVTREGVQLFHIFYWSDALRPLAGLPETRPVRYDPRDLSRIWLRAPDGETLALPYRRRHRPPLSLWEHARILAELRAEGKRAVDEDLIFDRRERMRAIVQAATATTKAARRARARLASETPSRTPSEAPDADAAPSAPGALFDVDLW